jgi:hypothetical protein
MPVNETLALREALRADLGLDLDLVVVNALLPDRFDGADAAALASRPSRATRIAGSLHARARAQRAQLARLRRGLGADVAITTLPYVFSGDLGTPQLAGLASRLAP